MRSVEVGIHARPGRSRRLVTLGVTAVLSTCAIWYGHAASLQPALGAAAAAANRTAHAPAGLATGGVNAEVGPSAAATAREAEAAPADALVVKSGDVVTIDYTGTGPDGQVFDSSQQSGPATFTVGSGRVIPGLEQAVVGLRVHQSVTVQLPPAQAYGDRRADLVVTVPSASAPRGLQVGERVQLGGRPAVVTQVTPSGVTVDANSPLAGKTLTFQITMDTINRAGAPSAPARPRRNEDD